MTTEQVARLKSFDPIYDEMTKSRMRFVRIVDSAFIEVADNDGRTQPDYRHIQFVRPIC